MMIIIITITSSSSIQSSADYLYVMLIADTDTSLPSLSSSSSFHYHYIIIIIMPSSSSCHHHNHHHHHYYHHHYICHHHHQPCLISWVNIAESPGLTLSPRDIFGKIPQKTSSAIFLKRSQWNILIVSNLLVGNAKEFAALVSPMMYFFQPGLCSTMLWNITN